MENKNNFSGVKGLVKLRVLTEINPCTCGRLPVGWILKDVQVLASATDWIKVQLPNAGKKTLFNFEVEQIF
jgi:hypothetical protein